MEASIEIAARSNYVFEGARDNDVVIFANNTSQRILIGASNTVATAAPISISATNVGIGTIPSSTYKLDVGGDIHASNITATRFYGDGSGLTGLTGVDATGGPTVWQSAYINGESNATFSGKVGINTDTPGANLDVVGDMAVSGSLAITSRLRLSGILLEKNTTGAMANVTASTAMVADGVQATTSSNLLIYPAGLGGIYSSNATVTVQDANHNTVFQVSALGTVTNQLAMFSNVELTGSLTRNGLPFTSGGGGQGWSNNFSGSVYTFSNVGIHTSTPQYGLDVNADVRFNSNMYFNNKIGMRGVRLDKRIPGANTANLTSMNIVGFSNLNSNVSIQTTGTDSTNFIAINSSSTNAEIARFTNQGYLGIGTQTPTSQLQLSTDSASKPATNTWTISSDARLKIDISLADLDMCYNAIKVLPLKRYTWKDEVYTLDQVPDRSKLGWIAQDVERVFPKAVTRSQQHGFDDCRSLNADQLYAAMYGAIQKLQNIVESQQIEIQQIKDNLAT